MQGFLQQQKTPSPLNRHTVNSKISPCANLRKDQSEHAGKNNCQTDKKICAIGCKYIALKTIAKAGLLFTICQKYSLQPKIAYETMFADVVPLICFGKLPFGKT